MSQHREDRPFSRRIPLIVAAAFFMEMLDSTIVATALPAIAQDLHASPLDLTASITVYMVAMAVFVPTAGWASARFGARRLFAAAIAVFTLASLLCGLSPSLPVLLVARLVQGTAAAFMSPVGRLVVLREAPKHRIIDAIGLIVWPALIAPVVGPPLGGFITTYASWRWIFLINIPLGIIGVLLVLRFVPKHAEEASLPFDGVGFVSTAVALAALIYGLSLVGQHDMKLGQGGLFIALGLASGAVAVRHALQHPSPMLDLSAARIPTFALTTVSAGVLARVAINMTPFLLPLMFQIGFGLTAFEAGVLLLVYMAGNLAMKSLTTVVLRRFRFRAVLLVNGVVCVGSLVALGLLAPGVPSAVIYGVLLVAGMTRSMHFTSTNTLAFADIPAALRAGATTLAAISQQAAGVLGVALAAVALAVLQALGGQSTLTLAHFHGALFMAAGLMAAGVAGMLPLPRDAGAELSRKP